MTEEKTPPPLPTSLPKAGAQLDMGSLPFPPNPVPLITSVAPPQFVLQSMSPSGEQRVFTLPPGAAVQVQTGPPRVITQTIATAVDATYLIVIGVLMWQHVVGEVPGLAALGYLLALRAQPQRVGGAVGGILGMLLPKDKAP